MPRRRSCVPGSARRRERRVKMSNLSNNLRKAAVLISALDDQAAETMLQQLTADEAAKIRRALVELPEVPNREQQEVLADFLDQQDAYAAPSQSEGDVALELDPAVEAAAGDVPPGPQPTSNPTTSDANSFAFLENVAAAELAALLSREMPQTTAVVIAHLTPAHAAAVLERLPAQLATSALERVAWLDELSPEIKTELISELRRQLAPFVKVATADASSLERLTAVLDAMDDRQRQRVVTQLGRRNKALLRRLGLAIRPTSAPNSDRAASTSYRLESERREAYPRLTAGDTGEADKSRKAPSFNDLESIDDATLRAVLAAVDADVALLALTGAPPRLVSRILRQLPPYEARVLEQRLEHPGPVRLRDIERAQAAVAAAASELIEKRKTAAEPAVKFAAAV